MTEKKHKHEEEVAENEETKAEAVAMPEDTSSEVEQLSAGSTYEEETRRGRSQNIRV